MADASDQPEEPLPDPAENQIVRFVVEPNYRGWRLDRYLCEKIGRLSRARAQAIVRRSLQCDREVKPSTPVVPGMVLTLVRRREPEPETPTHLPVVYRDEELLIVDKPACLPMHPTARYLRGTLVGLARQLARPGEKPDPAHRLDRETSGLVACGTRPESTRALKLAFARGEVRKAYLAIVEGIPEEETFEIDLPLSVGGAVVRVRAVVDREGGKAATTRVTVVSRHTIGGEPFSLLRCEPLTGRQHQIRAHLSAVGFPVVGDKIYGRDERIFVRFIEKTMTDADRAMLRMDRHALHAVEIAFAHPADGRPVRLAAPLPDDLARFLAGERAGAASLRGD